MVRRKFSDGANQVELINPVYVERPGDQAVDPVREMYSAFTQYILLHWRGRRRADGAGVFSNQRKSSDGDGISVAHVPSIIPYSRAAMH
ncbi:MAG: hypothetical protein A4E19_13540 [Nitrospira sp. SG-bin1]|nr:MAG: hypothetical protein A4E19_13540 [Nitrospira sp. SG-bin1]